jgi:hypothetical protein
MMTRRTVLMAAALLVGGATACSDLTGANARADGVYYLYAVDNTNLPASYIDTNTGRTFIVTSDQYVLNSDGTYNDLQIYTDNGQRSYTESGTWSQSSSIVNFHPTYSSASYYNDYAGTISSNNGLSGARSLSINFSGSIWHYSE